MSNSAEPASSSSSSSGPDALVLVALDLGWEMADLYADPHLKGRFPDPQDDLPTSSDLNPWQRTQVALAKVRVCVQGLSGAVSAAGLTVPSVDDTDSAFAGTDEAALRLAIWSLHDELFRCLHAVHANLGKAYDLGRSLAYTCSKPKDWEDLRSEFKAGRLRTLNGWLADLSSALPDHASRAVVISTGIWEAAIPDPGQDAKRRQGQLTAPGQALAALHRQGKLWRAVLTGAKDARQMLQPRDYVLAGARLCGRSAHFFLGFLLRTYLVVPLILAGAGYGISVILSSNYEEVTKLVGAIAAGLAALGISWKTTQATLGRFIGRLEQPLWNAEVDTAIGTAITSLNRSRWAQLVAQSPGRAAKIAPPARGPAE